MASVSPRSEDFSYVANPTNYSSPCSSESVPLLVPMSTLLWDVDTTTAESSSSPIDRDTSEKSLPLDFSDIISPLVFKEQNSKEETSRKPLSLPDICSHQFSYPDSQEYYRELESPSNGKIKKVGGIEPLSIESNERPFSRASCCCCLRYFTPINYFRLKFWSAKNNPH